LAQLRIRVIALENLVITLLAEASDSQIELVRRNGSLHLTKAGTVDLGIIEAALVRLVDGI